MLGYIVHYPSGLPLEAAVTLLILWVIAVGIGFLIERSEGRNKVLVRAARIGTTPQGKPVRLGVGCGPFDGRDRDQKIWNLAVLRDGKRATLWVRYDTSNEDAVIVGDDGKIDAV